MTATALLQDIAVVWKRIRSALLNAV